MKSKLRAATKKTQAQGKWAVWITHLDLSSLWAVWTLSFSQDWIDRQLGCSPNPWSGPRG